MKKFQYLFLLMLAGAILAWGVGQGNAQTKATGDAKTTAGSRPKVVRKPAQAKPQSVDPELYSETHKSAAQRRREAWERLRGTAQGQEQIQAAIEAAKAKTASPAAIPDKNAVAVTAATQPPNGINPAVDITLPNWSYSPSIRKFVDSLPGLGSDKKNNLGQYIPMGVPDQTTYPGTDYYEIALKEYNEKMHSDLPPTKLRGYVQVNMTTANINTAKPHYLGPVIVAQKGRAVRIKFTNMLPTGSGGDLFIPVDTTLMGAGMGPLDMPGMPGMKEMYTQNRGTLHLHGGLTPWISDGTPHQWVTPANEMTQYPKGVSVSNVPDMPDPGPGAMTFYYTNEQSARLMFYHDHAYGITRLNVYAGEAAGYVITDPVEKDLINGTNASGGNPSRKALLPTLGGAYPLGIPLIIQDKSFVNDETTPPGVGFPAGYTPTSKTKDVDPLWYVHIPTKLDTAGNPIPQGGNLWFPHEYLPNENLFDGTGFWPKGRWDYGPWILPPMFPMHDTLPSPSHVPEAFMDTMVVNGTPYPFVELPPTLVRLRILNACNDRMLNLQLYQADPAFPTEVKMVPAGPTVGFPDTWPVDGRAGGVPDHTLVGPDIWQIGNEGGFLAQVAELPAQPVNYDYDRTSAVFANVSDVALFLPPAVRADIIVDLSKYKDGDKLILYNDAPAPMSLYDSRYDIQTDDPDDRTFKGGVPRIPPGYGPNTRTIMQIRIKGTGSATPSTYLADLKAALPKAFAVAQPKIIVPAVAYNDAYSTNYQNYYAAVADETLNVTGSPQPVAQVVTELPGLGYTSPPTVTFYGGGGTGAAAVASLNGVTGIILMSGGAGYTGLPTVTITPAAGDTGTGATAVATVSGGVVTAINIINMGSNYLVSPTVTITGGGATTQATAMAAITLGSVGQITLTNPGSGYSRAPYVFLTGGGRGMGAKAVARLNGDMIMDGKNLVEGMDMEYGRMNAVLGSTPNPLTPAQGAGPVVGAAFYIDPPTEILVPENNYLWRIMHIGVDSHAIHFHLFDVQVINRVDWTNTVLPPYKEEIGWKETIRTNPFEDIIVALRPKVQDMKLPFGLPDSMRLLDPTMPANVIGMFQPAVPPIGVPAVAQIVNVMTNFRWEYVWHCHLLGHEENDMMRPIVLESPRAIPGRPTLSATVGVGQVNLSWIDPTPAAAASTLGNPANEIDFRIERATGTTGAFTLLKNGLANTTTTADSSVVANTTYRYRVFAHNAAGNSLASNIQQVTIVPPPPAAPSNLAASISGQAPLAISLTWTDNANNETGFTVQRATNATFTTGLTNYPVGANAVSYLNTTLATNVTYYYRVRATNTGGNSAWSNVVSMSTATPTSPANAVASVFSVAPLTIRMTWTDRSANEGQFDIDRATNSAFTQGLLSVAVGSNIITYDDTRNLLPNTAYYYRVRARNGAGASVWVNAPAVTTPSAGTPTPTPTPGGPTPTPTPTPPPIPAGLVAAYGFNEGVGPYAADASGSANLGTLSNATWTTAGRYGNGLVFNGTNSWVTITNTPSLQLTTGMTLEAWVYQSTAQNGWRTIMTKESGASANYYLESRTATGGPGAGIETGGRLYDLMSASAIPLNVWTHVATTWDGATMRLYVNGTQVGTLAQTGPITTSTGALRIGGSAVWGEFFQGTIDEVRVYNRALSPAEITADMIAPL